jgi:hypothetical protein
VLHAMMELLSAAVNRGGSADNGAFDLKAVVGESLRVPWSLAADRSERAWIVIPDVAPHSGIFGDSSEALSGIAVLPGKTSSVFVCRKVEGVPLQTLADEFVHGQVVYKELADNLHTRIDIAWDAFQVEDSISPPPAMSEPDSLSFNKTEPLPCLST